MKMKLFFGLLAFAFITFPSLLAAEPVFSGPQKGEKTTSFKVVELTGQNAGSERDPISENAGQPTVLLFVHGIERSLVPLLRVVDEYGVGRKDSLKTEIIFLFSDRLEGEQRVKAVAGSLKLQSRIGLSVDGIEGPGNYGLNKDCLMTLVIAKNNTVAANFALTQPGIADAPKVLEALADVSGDANPPSVEQLNDRQSARNGGAREGTRMGSERRMAPTREGAPDKPKDPFPGAVPTDGKLQGLLRSFIRPTNDKAIVDKVLGEVKEHIRDNPELRKQAVDGWTRVLHFGDRYGTEYSRKVGAAFLEELKRESQ
ncbi:MAG: hypothetical protein EOP84_16110 [Verrucomicrobiaceae bacterium]|nr:MAG: hypothetical protein EOP84_16110 [Verrucomicrobiaceae bacterium]